MNPLTLIARLLTAPFRFITGLFRSRPLPGESSQSEPSASARPQRESKDFYLPPDDAKSFGNIDYMRTPKSVRKTFTTYGGTQEGVEIVARASAMESAILTPSETSKPETLKPKASSASAPSSTESSVTPNRRASSDLDKFRKMAKDIGKKP